MLLSTIKRLSTGAPKNGAQIIPLSTLGLVLDGSGLARRSKTFEGNVSEGPILQVMLSELQAPLGALVIVAAGIATQDNIDWLIKRKCRYLVVRASLMRHRRFARERPMVKRLLDI